MDLYEKIKYTHQYGVGGGRLGIIILKKQFAAILGVLGAIANKMEVSHLWAKITQASLQLIKQYVPKKKASLQSYLIVLKGYVEKLERNYIDIWGVWGLSPPEASDISKNQIKWKPDIFFFTFWQCSLNPQKYLLAPKLP